MLPDSKVRKLRCKHIFHDQCVLNWVQSHSSAPQCPMCKTNPFEELIDASVLEASQLNLQVEDNSRNDEGFRIEENSSSRTPVPLVEDNRPVV